MTQPTDIELYDKLRHKIGDEGAAAVVALLDARIGNSHEKNIQTLATKNDVVAVEEKINGVEKKLSDKINDVQLALKNEITALTDNVNKRITETNRWMFGFFVMIILSLISLFFKK